MEKSIFRFLIFLCFFQYGFAQDSLCVYHIEGTIFLQSSTESKPLFKGDLLTKKDKLKLLPESQLTAIDNTGKVYTAANQGIYSFDDLLGSLQQDEHSSLTTKYFKYIWDELLNNADNPTLIAGVFRGNELMTFPKDSSFIASKKITFKWNKSETDLYYLFIINTQTEEVIKIETDGSQIALFIENPIFYDGNIYKWAISTKSFPNLKNIAFNTFTIINKKQYSDLRLKYIDLINDLNMLGLNAQEIGSILCETYGLCN